MKLIVTAFEPYRFNIRDRGKFLVVQTIVFLIISNIFTYKTHTRLIADNCGSYLHKLEEVIELLTSVGFHYSLTQGRKVSQ